ncbi:DUF5655 domain-containing protein [Arthrobacter sp. AK01]|uniref:DUF5655 domain-containing protein n=1 Tax=Arthrobacter sp. AK01 TaxID=2894084 RepID=UPI001E45D3BE|nr:DUF5655 domain-containing protein [Arthrobacter sp. AK01]MCD4851589.1 DUF5655 domain-containing protein [Arthrobacter sp. AK01]
MTTVLPTDAVAFFNGSPQGLAICEAVFAIAGGLGDFQVHVSKSQVALRRHRGFAYLWRPYKYVHSGVPAVLSLALPYKLDSPRFKEIAHPAPSVWMHHVELHNSALVDAEVAK